MVGHLSSRSGTRVGNLSLLNFIHNQNLKEIYVIGFAGFLPECIALSTSVKYLRDLSFYACQI